MDSSFRSPVSQPDSRIVSLDFVRGLIMVIMALDHCRDLLHLGANQQNPLDLSTTSPILFFTRWITHFCAPGFVFLAGLSAFLYGYHKGKSQLRQFLISRGFWLFVIDFVVMTFILTLDPDYNLIVLSVLFAIGLSMIVLGFLIQLPWKILFALGLIFLCCENLINPVADPATFTGMLKAFSYSVPTVVKLSEAHSLLIAYSFLPWTAVMLLGFAAGNLFVTGVSARSRFKILMTVGIGSILGFTVLRLINSYGDLAGWSVQKNSWFTWMSFLNTNKYPPSLQFLLMTLGPILVLLALSENSRGRMLHFFSVYGEVPFFYYILHFILIRIISLIVFFAQGFGGNEIKTSPFYFHPDNFGLNLPVVYFVWILVVALMYPFCRWFGMYKRKHRKKWWISYL